MEAMSAGLVVIAPNVGAISELVNGGTGFLIEDDPDEERLARQYVKAISSLYEAQTELGSLSAASIEVVKKRHSPDAFVSRIRDMFPPNI
jgi:glycosyltransferase involved in cell wall biosynthesis